MLTLNLKYSHLKLMTTVQLLARVRPKVEWAWHDLKITLLTT